MIQRWKSYDKSYIMPNNHEGDFVKYDDYAAEIERLRKALDQAIEVGGVVSDRGELFSAYCETGVYHRVDDFRELDDYMKEREQ